MKLSPRLLRTLVITAIVVMVVALAYVAGLLIVLHRMSHWGD